MSHTAESKKRPKRSLDKILFRKICERLSSAMDEIERPRLEANKPPVYLFQSLSGHFNQALEVLEEILGLDCSLLLVGDVSDSKKLSVIAATVKKTDLLKYDVLTNGFAFLRKSELQVHTKE